MRRVLITGMSGSGKSTVVEALAARGYHAVDLDTPEWSKWVEVEPADRLTPAPGKDWVWQEDRVRALLSRRSPEPLFVSGCAQNMTRLFPLLDRIILLSAPVATIMTRLEGRSPARYGGTEADRRKVAALVATIEPLLRQSADHVIDTSGPVDTTIDEIVAVAGCRELRPEARMTRTELADFYRGYIACLNEQAWERLDHFVHEEAHHNGRRLGLSGYRAMLERDYREIPDLRFDIRLLISEPPFIASRLAFDCTPVGVFLSLPVNGRRISFAENVFYEFLDGKILEVWSVIDKAAIEAQLRTAPAVATRAGMAP